MLHGRAFFAVPDAVWSYKLARYRVLKMRALLPRTRHTHGRSAATILLNQSF